MRYRRVLLVFVGGVLLLPLATAEGVGDAPRVTGLRGSTTLTYTKPFKTCTGAGGSSFREVLNWIGRGTLRSNNRFLNGRKVVDNVNFFQNASTGVGLVSGSIKTLRSGKTTARGKLTAVWRGTQGRGQIVLRPVARSLRGSVYILNASLRLRSLSNGTAVDIAFGKRTSFGAPSNSSATFNGSRC